MAIAAMNAPVQLRSNGTFLDSLRKNKAHTRQKTDNTNPPIKTTSNEIFIIFSFKSLFIYSMIFEICKTEYKKKKSPEEDSFYNLTQARKSTVLTV